jgi:Tol biopolymer transport system component
MTSARRSAAVIAATTVPLLFAVAMTGDVRVIAQSPLGWFEGHGDVGNPAIAGSTSYDPTKQEYSISAAGTNMWDERDEFHVAWRKMTGDFILRTHAAFLGKGVDPHRKMGWIVRSSLDPSSAYVDAAVHGDGMTSLQFRRAQGAKTEETRSAVTGPDVVQLERRGRTFVMSVAKLGDTFTRTELTEVDLGDAVYVGLFVCSHNPKVVEKAVFSNVRIVVPPKTGWTPYRDYIGSNLEILTVATGERRVIHTAPGSFQAPNWTLDGRALIYNQDGKLYRFDLQTKTPALIDTGFAISNNNDHVLSFDGKMLAISHHATEDQRRSVVYTLPTTGGTPKRITAKSPSYLHGWSPDGKWLVYTGGRSDNYDIYRISVDGGEEIRLTTDPALDDGPEYTPDGQWIYFNSTRSGLMQIWRMRPDGSGQERITHDEHNNWFPHIAPDGKSMVIISYGQDVEPRDHPFYRHVYIRQMGLDGSNPKVIAYVFGGQGTINVPSWSPDGTRIAFVSNSAMTAPH